VTAGLSEGDRILRNPGSTLVDGQKVEFANAASAVDLSADAARPAAPAKAAAGRNAK